MEQLMPDAATEAALDPAIVLRASEWMARLWSDSASEEDRAACASWRAESSLHELAWQRLQAFEDKLYQVPREVARHTLSESAPAAYLNRRSALQVLSLLMTAGGLAYAVRGTETWQIATASYSSAREIREITLADGSRVVLAPASAIDLRFNEQERLLILRAGEILVTTASDPSQRPFRVQSRHGLVRALGTRFTLRQDAHITAVAVFEGKVELRPAHAPHQPVLIETGQGASFSAAEVQPSLPVAESAAAWARGLLLADNMRLDELIAELAPYRSGLLRCDLAVAHLKVSGVFSLRDTDRALQNLVLGLPVKLVSRTRYWITVQAAS